MSDAKHTPGPWTTSGTVVSARVGASQRPVCEISIAAPSKGKRYSVDDHRPELMANARLIAAAPELLEALEQAGDIVQQANLLSTASDADRRATIQRLVNWLNGPRLAALRSINGEVSS